MNEQAKENFERLALAVIAVALCVGFLTIVAAKFHRLLDVQAQEKQGESATSLQKNPEPRSLPVRVRQLDAVAGAVPVNLTCEDAKLIGTGELLQLPCSLQNNSLAAIVAGSLHVLTTIEIGGKEDVLSSYETFDMVLHPDFREEKKNSFVKPGKLFRIDVMPADYLEATVKSVEVEIDYVTFLDGSSVGPNQAGSRIIDDIRAGAAKYKNWLGTQYSQNGRSITRVEQLLENESLTSADIGLQNSDQISGANMYRKYVRRMNKLNGPGDFLKHLMVNK